MKKRTEKDSIGEILVDADKYWGAQELSKGKITFIIRNN